MSAGLSLEQRRSLQSFQEITQLQDENLCMEILLHNEWDVDRSVEQLLSGRISSPSSHPGTAAARADQQVGATSSNGVFGFLELLFVPLRWLFQSQPLSLNPDQDTVRFVEEFNAKYGSNHAPLVTTSYQTAVATSHAQHKFLVVYLHSPLHEDADNFCSQVLCSSRLTQVLGNDQVLFWAGRVWDPEGYALSSQLRASAFPFLAVLVCQSQRMVQIVTKVQGVTDVEEIASQLQRGMSSFSDVILQNRLTSERRSEAARLREEQDREYQESMLREQAALAAQRQEEEAREAAKQAEELAEAVEMSRQLARKDEIRKLRAAFESTPEPADGPTVVAIRFQLPRGKKLARRFERSEMIQRIYDYLRIFFFDEGELTKNFMVSTNYPKMELSEMTKTIEEMGLPSRCMLFVQDLDA